MPRLSEPMREFLGALAQYPTGTGIITTRGRANRDMAARAAKNGWVEVVNGVGACVVVRITPEGRAAIGQGEGATDV